MSNNYLRKIAKPDFELKRSLTKVNFRPCVLSTDIVPLSKFEHFTGLMKKVSEHNRKPWFIHYQFHSTDPQEDCRRVPKVLYSINRSRVLRRAKISGLRMCNFARRGTKNYYVCDFVVSCLYDAAVIASGLYSYHNIASAEITFTSKSFVGRGHRQLVNQRHNELLELFWRRSKLPRHFVDIERIDDDILKLGLITWRISSDRDNLIDVIYKILEVLHDDVEDVSIANGLIRLSRTLTADPMDYTIMPFDRLILPRFRKYSAFGSYHNNPDYILY